MIAILSMAALLFGGAPASPAGAFEIRTEPTEIITATPLSTFSGRAGLWPSSELAQDHLNSTSKPLSESYNSTPGLQAREEGSPTLSIRGSAQADRVLKLFEGISLNFADGMGGRDLFLPHEALSSLRVFKGPASAFYGGSAMGGATDARLRLFERPAIRVSVSDDTGVLGTRSLFGAVPIGTTAGGNKPFAQATLFQERKPGSFAYNSVSTSASGRRENNSQDLTRGTLSAEVRRGGIRYRSLLLAVQADAESPGSLNYPDITRSETKGTLAGLDVEGRWRGQDQWNVRMADIRLWGSYSDPPAGNDSRTFSSRTSLLLDSRNAIFESSQARTFIDLRADRLANTLAMSGQPLTETQAELGQSYDLSLTPALTLQPAYRYRPASGDWFRALGLLRSENRAQQWLTYSEGFRAPSLTDRFANGSSYLGNPGLLPERSRAVELGGSFEQGRRFGGFLEGFRTTGSVYMIRYDNLVDSTTVSPGVTKKINTGRARAYGGEAGVGYGVSVWSFSASYGYLDAKNEDSGEALRLAPEHQLSLSASCQLGPLVFEVEDTLWSPYLDRDFSSGSLRRLPGWSSIDLNIRTIGLNDWEVRSGVLNILDTPRELTLDFPEPQRRFYLSALRYF